MEPLILKMGIFHCYCWWFRNPANQLIWYRYPFIYRFFSTLPHDPGFLGTINRTFTSSRVVASGFPFSTEAMVKAREVASERIQKHKTRFSSRYLREKHSAILEGNEHNKHGFLVPFSYTIILISLGLCMGMFGFVFIDRFVIYLLIRHLLRRNVFS